MQVDFTPRVKDPEEQGIEAVPNGMVLSPLAFDNNFEVLAQHYELRGQKLAAVQKELDELKKKVAVNKSAAGAHGEGPRYGLDVYWTLSLRTIYWQRVRILVPLLLLQSVSGMILEGFNEMLDKHLCIAIFLPMIIGSGGNAGNQPGVMVTQALSEGQIERAVLWKYVSLN